MIFYQVLDYQVQAFIKYKNGVVQKSFESWDELGANEVGPVHWKSKLENPKNIGENLFFLGSKIRITKL